MENKIIVSDHIQNTVLERNNPDLHSIKTGCPYCGIDITINHDGKKFCNEWTCPDCKGMFVFSRTGMVSKLDWEIETNRISNLHKLPSEQQKAVKKAVKKLEETKELYIEEPCDCGSMIMHNNGGNYHDWYDIKIDNGTYFVMEGSTCELNPPYTWESSTKEKVLQLIQNCADWL